MLIKTFSLICATALTLSLTQYTNAVIYNVPSGNAPDVINPADTVNLSGTGVIPNNAEYSGTLNMTGGTVGSYFSAETGSEINIHAGTVDANFRGYDNTTINITGGSLAQTGRAFGNSIFNISGGSISYYFALLDDSVLNMTGGFIDSFLDVQSTLNISGGNITSLAVNHLGTVNVTGYDFSLTGGTLPTLTAGTPTSIQTAVAGQVLSGKFADGTSFTWELDDNTPIALDKDAFYAGSTLNLILIPEPATLSFLALPLLLITRRN
ncbi:hypothetical protein [Poriferisphaera sp. WC338]|uniref:hypothetical protein n=1 Tax=Poriferisphaera sp. WC338 TaxID=3425129 RepID=UPI003D8178D6